MLPGAFSGQGSRVSRGAQAQSSGPRVALTSLAWLSRRTDRLSPEGAVGPGNAPCSSEPQPGDVWPALPRGRGRQHVRHVLAESEGPRRERWLCGHQPSPLPLIAVTGAPSVVSHRLASAAANLALQ